MKKYLFFAATTLALASCSSDDYLGNNPGNENGASSAINFGGGTGKTTRADGPKTGSEAATDLHNNFIVYGYKTVGDQNVTVFDHYNVGYTDGTAGSTESNTAGWEYVNKAINDALNESKGKQTIKYWDYNASQYDFIAFSFGKATQGTGTNEVEATRVDNTKPSYTLKGEATDLADCYIADRVSAKNKATAKEYKLYAYGNEIKFNFRSLSTKVRMGIYETVPGYSVKDVKFYDSEADNTGSDKPTLFTTEGAIAAGKGTMTVSFGSNTESDEDFNQANVSWAADGQNASNIQFGALNKKGAEDKEAAGENYLGRNAKEVSLPNDYNTVISGTTVNNLTLKVDYTLVSTDGSGEEITVKGASAVIPATFTNWQPNYAYTYIFKITDNTNGTTGTGDDPKGLYPITFDAVVTETENGLQETTTTVATPSITTYSNDANETTNHEYKAGKDIYVAVYDANTKNNAALYVEGENINANLYTASLAEPTKGSITESLVNLCLGDQKTNTTGPWTLANNGNKLTVTTKTGLSVVENIPASATANGNTITGNFAKFTPDAAGTYVFQYTYTEKVNGEDVTKKAYKVIKVVD